MSTTEILIKAVDDALGETAKSLFESTFQGTVLGLKNPTLAVKQFRENLALLKDHYTACAAAVRGQ